MSSLKISLLAFVASAAVTVGCLVLLRRGRAHEAAALISANHRLQIEIGRRVAAVNPPISASSLRSGNTGAIAQPTRPEASALPMPESLDYRNEGQTTPQAALQTFAWACDRGDADRVTRMLCFGGAGRAKADAFMAALPANARAQWHSPEAMAGTLLTSENMNHPYPVAKILELATPEIISDDRVVLHLEGATLPKQRTEFQRTGGDWKYVVTEAVVDDFIARARAGTAAAH